MPNSIAGSAPSHTLKTVLAERGALSPKIGLAVFRQLLRQARALHASGATHRAIGPETVLLDATGRATLAAAEPMQELDRADADCCPPELQGAGVVRLSAGIEAAQQELSRAGVVLDPRRIDVYQLGVLLCRMLTGEAVLAYLSSPKVSSKVPVALRPLIERALGHCAADRFADCDSYNAALETDGREAPVASPETPAAGSAVVSSPNTPPERADLSDQDPPLTRLGHYRVDKRIGRGGMGDVYRGYEESLQRPVAIKVLPVELARDEDFVRRFRAEAAAAAQLAHPNIVPVYFIGRDAGVHFFVMQYVEGESLDRLLARKGRLGVEEALGILEQSLAGLGTAHRAGLIHRDVKPGNILLDGQTGRALVADFGLVKTVGAGGGMTATGVVLGTVDYIAPEQARGRDVDGRADLYALGVLAYQMFSGRLPFRAETPSAMIFQHAYETPTPLLEVAPQTPVPLAAVVDKLMAKDPAARYQTCEEVLADFRRWRAGEPVQTGPRQPPAEPPPIRTTLDLEQPPALPFPVKKARPWQRLRDRLMDWFQARAPELVKSLQNTEQQVDAAVADYQRRRDRLAGLMNETAETASALEDQAKSHRAAASVAARRADGICERDECERIAADLEAQAAEHQQHLAQMRAQLVQVDATLNRLRGQSELLRSRLRVAQARLRLEAGPSRPARPSRRLWVAAAAVGGSVGLLLSAVMCYALWPSRSTIKTEAGGDRIATVTRDAGSAPETPAPNPTGHAPEAAAIEENAREEITNTIGMRLKLIQAGWYMMGSPPGEAGRNLQEGPQHLVEITRPFHMGLFPVTKGQFAEFVRGAGYATDAEKSGDFFKYTWRSSLFTRYEQSDDDPVINVSWNDAVQFCAWLSKRERKTYQLPTEAEWEYACRAGTTTAYSFGNNVNDLGAYAWYQGNSMSHTHPVGGKLRNPWGLYDMHGNVCQWCADGYLAYKSGSAKDPKGPDNNAARVYRGGSFGDEANICRSAFRNKMASNGHGAMVGFRVVLRPVGGSDADPKGGKPPPVVDSQLIKPEAPTSAPALPQSVADNHLFKTGLLTLPPSEAVTAAFSPNGKRLFTGGPTLRLWDLERDQVVRNFPVTPLFVTHAAVWSRDGKRVLVGGSILPSGQISGVAILYDADTGKIVMSFRGHSTPVGAVAFSPDGRQVLTGAGGVLRKVMLSGSVAQSEYQDTEIRRWDAATGMELQRYTGPTAPNHSIAFSADGKRVFAAGSVEDRAIYSWNMDNPQGQRMDFGNRGVRTYIVLTDDASKAGYVGTNSVLFTYDLNVRNQLTEGIRTQPLPVYPENPIWSRDGRYLACSSMKYANMQGKAPIYLADMLTGRVTTFEGHPLSTQTLAVSDDGRFIFSASKDGNRLWDSSSQPEVEAKPAAIAPEVKAPVKPPPPVRTVELFEANRRVNAAVAKLKENPRDLDAIQSLIEGVKDPDGNIRRTAGEFLLQLHPHPKAAAPGYAALLNTDNALDTRLRAAEALWEVNRKGAEVLPVLIEGVRNPTLRQQALTIMARLGPEAKDALPELTPLLQARSLPTVLSDVFSDIGPDAVPPLMEVLTKKGVAAGQAQNMLGGMGSDAAPSLLMLLNDPDLQVRSGVIMTLGQVAASSPEVIPALIEAAQKGEANQRLNALTALGIAGPAAKEAVPILLEAVKSNDPIPRQTALQALVNIHLDQTALPALNEAVKDYRPYDRAVALELRWRVDRQTESAVKGLTSIVADNPHDRTAGQTAMAGLNRIAAEDKSAAHALAGLLQTMDGPSRSRAALLLANLGLEPETVVPLLVEDVKSPFVGSDLKAADALALYGKAAASAVPALQGLLKNNPWPYVATKAAEALYRIDPSQKATATEALLDVIYHRLFPAERYAAAAALCRIDPSNAKAVAVLREGLLDPNQDTRVSALTWCARAGTGCRELLPLIETSLENETDLGRMQAATAFWKVGGTDQATHKAVAILMQSLKEPTYAAVRGQAAEHLGEMGVSAKAAAPALTAALRDRSSVVRSAAAEALRKVDPEAAAAAGVP